MLDKVKVRNQSGRSAACPRQESIEVIAYIVDPCVYLTLIGLCEYCASLSEVQPWRRLNGRGEEVVEIDAIEYVFCGECRHALRRRGILREFERPAVVTVNEGTLKRRARKVGEKFIYSRLR